MVIEILLLLKFLITIYLYFELKKHGLAFKARSFVTASYFIILLVFTAGYFTEHPSLPLGIIISALCVANIGFSFKEKYRVSYSLFFLTGVASAFYLRHLLQL
ncbi:hypothetical protein [Alteribacter keqinensis]|uniref:Uncharacterized protein n=1 Tax=Alteribacter keqinensis TaxID=2483800 RepID=A0A3M7TMQ2_9BACI|nr:hypothetical protein [Alteribacter keqinensis]RNA66891.1 hypothetical protein EBO34_16950 [Alteribacter keqinensis]